MTTKQSAPAMPRAAVSRPPASRPLLPDVIRAEWTKLRTVRSTFWTLLVGAGVMVGFGAILSTAYVTHYAGLSRAAKASFDAAAYSLSGYFFAQLAIGVLGVLVITSEYQTGAVRSTLAAVPQRLTVLAAKAVVFAAVATAVGLVSSVAAFFAGQTIFARKNLDVHLGDPGAVRSVVGAALYLAVIGLLALGLGTLIRRTAGAIAALVGVVFILPAAAEGLPASWQNAISKYVPTNAGQALIGRTKFAPAHLLTPWTGFAVFCGYAAVALIAGAVMLTRRDA